MQFAHAIFGLSAASLLAPPVFAQSIALSPGQWETAATITVSIEENGEPATPVSPRQHVRDMCVSPVEALLVPQDIAGPECTPTNINMDGQDLRFDVSCVRADGTYSGNMVASTSPDGEHTTTRMELIGWPQADRQVQIVAVQTSHRTGPCL